MVRHGRALSIAVATVVGFGSSLAAVPAPASAHSAPITRRPTAGSLLPVRQLIVHYRVGAVRGGTETVVGSASVPGAGLRPGVGIGGGTTTVRLGRAMSAADASAVARQLAADPRVDYAEPDLPVAAYGDPAGAPLVTPQAVLSNDPRVGEQWPLTGTYGIRVQSAWPHSEGSGVIVAVLDTGITAHPDLVGQTVPGADLITDPAVSNDGDGRDLDPSDPGDYYTDGTGFHASSWHGTHVSGTIAAATDNGIGIAGVAPLAKVEMVRVLGAQGGYQSDVDAGIYWAVGDPVSGLPTNPNPAQVISMSLGGPGSCPSSTQAAIDEAVSKGVTVVVAAGNSSADAATSTPASCNHVVVVSAVGVTGTPAWYSNFGSHVDLAAPGGDDTTGAGVLSTLNDGASVPGTPTYAYYEGTSMATPHVSGAVALLLAEHPGLTPAQVELMLKQTARPVAQCSATHCGAGLLDAAALVSATVPAAPTGVSATRLSGALRPSWSAASAGGLPLSGYTATAYDASSAGTAVGTCTTTSLTCTISGLTNGTTYFVDVLAMNALGDGAPSSPRVAAAPRVDPVSRLFGSDRYATSAAISAASFAPGVSTVYVATGTTFPDALSAAPVAAMNGGPVLLVTPTAIPGSIAAELTRLAPAQIVVIGGTGAVSASVETALHGYAPDVQRLSGTDRYSTSAAISAASFTSGVDTAYIATGTSFPDALSGAAVAGHGNGPVLLVAPNALPAVTATELTRLAPTHIVVLGGTGAVSAAVATQLTAYAGDGQPPTRLSGANRYETSAVISLNSFAPNAAVVYVATGTTFPDALSGAAVAGSLGAPVLLVTPTTIPTTVATELARLAPSRIVVLGGTGAVSDALASALELVVP